VSDRHNSAPVGAERSEARLAWAFVLPALSAVLLIAIFPLAWTVWESLHLHDLRMPWRGRPFVGLDNYAESLGSPRFWGALGHTAFFTISTVALEVLFGLILALALRRAFRGRGLIRTAVLLPWAIPTVVTALLWGFLFDSRAGIVNAVAIDAGVMDAERPLVWFNSAVWAWVPVILADVWKMTPFVTLLLLAGLQNVDEALYEAARMDGAGPWQQFVHVTLPQLRPALLVTLIFRTLDGFRVFDLIYVMTHGGPGTATEPVALYAFDALFDHLRFGYGSALSVIIFVATFLLALVYLRVLGAGLTGRPE
jgi:ABC-type sugar transport system permease subunit